MPSYLIRRQRAEAATALYLMLRHGGMSHEDALARVAVSYPPLKRPR